MKCFKNLSNFPLILIAVQNSLKGSVTLSLYTKCSHLGIPVFKVHKKNKVTMPEEIIISEQNKQRKTIIKKKPQPSWLKMNLCRTKTGQVQKQKRLSIGVLIDSHCLHSLESFLLS